MRPVMPSPVHFRVSAALIVTFAVSTINAASALAASPDRPPVFACTLVVEAGSGEVLRRDGDCDRRVSPASTFKVPLALMGYDAGILVDGRSPRWEYQPEFNAVKRDRRPVDPTIWLRDSVVWYSQQITRKLGAERFAGYVAEFDYGNRDISGNPGKQDGLTHSWLSSSLSISPDEQVRFLRQITARTLPVSADALDRAAAVIPAFEAGEWHVKGKTGTGWLTGKDGELDRGRPFGWFVGWAEKDGRRVVFAKLAVNDGKSDKIMGPKMRDQFLADLPVLLD